MFRNSATVGAVIVAIAVFWTSTAVAQGGQEDLAKTLQNPVANLISVPIQANYDWDIGPDRDGIRQTFNVQPVIPVNIGGEWLVVSRTIMPIVSQDDIFAGSGKQIGLGDTLQSLFIVPPTVSIPGGQFIYGLGPVFLLPTGTDKLLSAEKWGAGPTAVGLAQIGGWTAGALANHIWSFEGDDLRADVDQTFIQPFVSYTTKDAWTFGVSADMTFNWETDEWTIPVGVSASKLVTFGDQPVSLGAKTRYYAETTEGGPHGWAFQTTVTFLFPTGGK